MENSTLDFFSNFISNKFSTQLDEELIKFYLYTKRNYFIKNLIKYGESKDINFGFTEHINNYQKNRLHPNEIRWEYWHYKITDDIIDRILEDKIKDENLICEISIRGNVINKDIFLQESILFGLNHKDYILIHEKLIKIEEQKNQQNRDEWWEMEKKKFGPENKNWDEIFKRKIIDEPLEDEVIIERALDEIKLLSSNNKVKQEDIILNL
jgi:hypothetical protein